MRLSVDGVVVFDRWRDQAPIMMYGDDHQISAGNHLVTVEFYSRTGRPTAHLSWTKTGDRNQGAPVVTSFTATPSAIAPGQGVTLAWNVIGATSVKIDGGVGEVPPGAWRSLFPTHTTTYRLTATNGSTSVTAAATVVVNAGTEDKQPPSTPAALNALASGPGEVRLTWTPSTDNIGVARYQITRDGALLATVQHPASSYIDKTVSAGATYTYGVVAYDNGGNGSALASARVSTPAPSASVSCSTPSSNTYSACYYRGASLAGTPFLGRTDNQIDFGPNVRFPSTLAASGPFSVRWDGTFPFESGSYVFTVTASDGIRLYLDGVPTFDRWVDQRPSTYVIVRSPGAGEHRITVEYYSQTGSPVAQVSWRKQ
jgi:hypothetical protein